VASEQERRDTIEAAKQALVGNQGPVPRQHLDALLALLDDQPKRKAKAKPRKVARKVARKAKAKKGRRK
jgi:hypothetical protein